MKPYLLCMVAACTGLTLSAKARDILPAWHFETQTATDGSGIQSLSFTTTPGFQYRIEASDDLVTWQTASEIYGLGQDFVHPLREIAPPPPPAPGSPPAEPAVPARHIALIMAPCSDSGGGTVVSWPALEDGSAIRLHIPETMAGEWLTIPFYFERFGAFEFCVLRTADSLPAPAIDSVPNGADAEVLATLQASLPAMNASVIASAIAARNAPPPAPAATGGKKFLRIRVTTLDTDGDGITDDAEFALAAAPTGGPIHGDPFDADTNHDGIPDGEVRLPMMPMACLTSPIRKCRPV